MTFINQNTRIAYALAIVSKHSKYATLGLKALIYGLKFKEQKYKLAIQEITEENLKRTLCFCKQKMLTNY